MTPPTHASRIRPQVIADFDGTLTLRDIGSSICAHFRLKPYPEALKERWLAGDISLPGFQGEVWQTVGASPDDAAAFVERIGAWRRGASRLFEHAQAGALELTIASGGFGFYIRQLLAEWPTLSASAYFNEADLDAGGCEAHFPHADLHCGRCAICKARVVERIATAHPAAPLVFCGDGRSDACIVDLALRLPQLKLFAVRGSYLEDTCRTRACPHTAFDAFDTVLDALALPT